MCELFKSEIGDFTSSFGVAIDLSIVHQHKFVIFGQPEIKFYLEIILENRTGSLYGERMLLGTKITSASVGCELWIYSFYEPMVID